MVPLIYILTGSAFYWLAYRNAPEHAEDLATHPLRAEAETIILFPEEVVRKAA